MTKPTNMQLIQAEEMAEILGTGMKDNMARAIAGVLLLTEIESGTRVFSELREFLQDNHEE